jgi:hypothetical protein
MADRVVGLAGVIARDHLDRAPEQTAGGVDFLDREFPRLAIRHEKLRNRRVAVDLADPDRHRSRRTLRADGWRDQRRSTCGDQHSARDRQLH